MTSTMKRRSSNSDNDECPLTDAEALAACKEFVSITNTDSALAMMMLQQNGWNLDHAVSTYLDLTLNNPKSTVKQISSDISIEDQQHSVESKVKRIKIESTTDELSKVKRRFKILSWNIDGLDEQSLEIRTRSVVNIIKREEPDAVFLQEVIPTTLRIIRTLLPEYTSYAGNIQAYFVVILIKREMFRVHGFEIIAYPGTNMGRNLLIVHTTYKNSIEIDLMTTHHESGVEGLASQERMEQLKLCFKRMVDAPSNRIVLFGGDLNMREKELQKVGNIPFGICDLWIETGKRPECAYTWDMSLNTNNSFSSTNFRPRARFDRLYYRSSIDTNIKFQPIYFELEGLEKLSSIQRYCSDHWAIQAYFDI